jgi:hypothetical protein
MNLERKSDRLDQLQTASPPRALSRTSDHLSDPGSPIAGHARSLLEVLR